MGNGIARILLCLLAVTALLSPSAAHAATDARVTLSPAEIAVGDTTVVALSGLDGVDSVRITLDPADVGSFAGVGSPESAPTTDVAVTGGEARIEVTALRAGDLVVTAESGPVFLQATAIVTAPGSTASPGLSTSPSSSPRASDDSALAAPDPEAENGRLVFVLIPLIAAVVIGVGAVLMIAKSRRGRRGD